MSQDTKTKKQTDIEPKTILTPRRRTAAFTTLMKEINNLVIKQKAAAVAALKTPTMKVKEILIPSPRESTGDENTVPIVQEDEKKKRLTIRLPGRRRSQILTPISSTLISSKASIVPAPEETYASSASATLVSAPQTEKPSQANKSSPTISDETSQRKAVREEHVKFTIDKRVEERLVQWEKKFDAQLEWIENKWEDRINERTQQLKNLLDERTAELEWSLILLSKSVAANERLGNALEETQREVCELKRHICVPEKTKTETYRRVNDPQRQPFAKWRRNPATAGNRPLPINTQIASDHGKRMDLPLLTQSESPGLSVKSAETKSTSVVATKATPSPVERGRRRERKRQREEEEPGHVTHLVDRKGKASMETPDRPRIRCVRGPRESIETRSPPNKRTKLAENLLKENTEILDPKARVGEWADIDLPEGLYNEPDSPHRMMLSPRSRGKMARK